MSGFTKSEELDPFMRTKPIEFCFPQFSECSSLTKDEYLYRTTRSFVTRALKPRYLRWLASTANMSIDDLAEGAVSVLSLETSVKNFVFNTLRVDPSEPIVKTIFDDLPLMLVHSCDVKDIARRLIPFILRLYVTFRANVAASDVYQDYAESTQIFEALSEFCLRSELSVPNQLQVACELLQVMLSPFLGLRAVIISTVHSAYTIICRSTFQHIIEKTGGLLISHIQSTMSMLLLFLKTLPSIENVVAFLPIAEAAQRSVYTTVIDLLTKHVYDLTIVQFPKSFHTIQTLRFALQHTGDYGRDKLVARIVDDVLSKLLRLYVDTSTILDGYAACVESLRELDPSCAIMHRVCAVIKEYLKKRPDTVRKIITYITSEKRDQLAEHLGGKQGTILDEEEFAGTNDELLPEAMDTSGWDEWTADPPDAAAGTSGHIRQAADVFNMLISVYGSKELFVKEYRKLLSERLTSSVDKDPEFEQRYIEVLKQRFNEGELQQCEVMLKDIEESLRIDRTVAALQCVPMSGCIISSHFWPAPDQQDKVEKYPPPLEEGLKCYEQAFKEQKLSRRLNWLRSWGWVEVTIELGGVAVDKLISHANAAVLYLYAEKDNWSVTEVCESLSISKGVARRRLDWWSGQGLIVQELPPGSTCEVWRLVESAKGVESARQAEESEDEDQMALEDTADAIDALEVYWIYTRNFISQNDNVKAERIHKIFKMFTSPSTQGPSLDTVIAFLNRKVKQNLLVYANGHYKVVKDAVADGNK